MSLAVAPEVASGGIAGGRSRWRAALRAVVHVRDDELAALGGSCLFFFCLLAVNYVLRPVRDEMGIAGGIDRLPWLFTGTFLVLLLAYPIVAALRAGRGAGPGRRPRFYRVLQVHLASFFILFWTLPAVGVAVATQAFFLWASVCNLLILSVAWGFLSDVFTADQARRLFGFVGAGGTLGAICGSAAAAGLVRWVGPTGLLLVAVGLLEIGHRAACFLLDATTPARPADPEPTAPEAAPPPAPARSGLYLTGLGACTLLFTITSAFIYLEQARIVAALGRGPAARTALFARIDLGVNLLSLALQVLLAGRVIALLGVGGTAALLPLVTLAGSVGLAARPTLAVLVTFQVLRRAIDYAVARPSREILYTAVPRRARSRAKGFIDTAVYRAGDAVGAGAYGLLSALFGASVPMAAVIAPLTLLWATLCLVLGRRAHPEQDERFTAETAEEKRR